MLRELSAYYAVRPKAARQTEGQAVFNGTRLRSIALSMKWVQVP